MKFGVDVEAHEDVVEPDEDLVLSLRLALLPCAVAPSLKYSGFPGNSNTATAANHAFVSAGAPAVSCCCSCCSRHTAAQDAAALRAGLS